MTAKITLEQFQESVEEFFKWFTFALGKITALYSLGGEECFLADYNHLNGLWTTMNNTIFNSFEVH